MNEGEAMMRQFGPLVFMILFSVLINIMGSVGTTSGSQYRFSFTQTYTYPEQLISYRLNQIYYVSPYTVRDFRQD